MLLVTGTQIAAATNPSKWPIFKLEYFDSPYGTKTRGFKVKYFNDPDQASTTGFNQADLAYEGQDSILAYDWGFGAPPGVSDTGFWKARYYGYFYGKYTGTYVFRVIKSPEDYVRLWFRRNSQENTMPTNRFEDFNWGVGASSTTSGWVTSIDLAINEWGTNHQGKEIIDFSQVINSASTNKWHALMIEFAQRGKGSYLALQILEPDGAIQTISPFDASDHDTAGLYHASPVAHRKVVSSSNLAFNPKWNLATGADFLTPTTLSMVNGVSFNQKSNQSNTLTFTVPYHANVTNTSGQEGFRRDPNNGLFYNDQLNLHLRQGRYIKYYAGYSSNQSNPSSSDYIQRFEGIITDINLSRSLNESNIEITCQDILYLPIDSIHENYPNPLSYALFGYVSNSGDNQPNGLTRPTAYDAWPLDDVVRDLLIKSNVDPDKLYGRKKIINRNKQVTTGDYYISDKDIVLKRKIRYGNPYLPGDDPNRDEKYIWSFNFGDKNFDSLSKLADTYGYLFEASADGKPIFGSNNTYESIHTETGWTGNIIDYPGNTDWLKVVDINAEGGYYISSQDSGTVITGTVIGSTFAINLVKTKVGNASDYKEWSMPIFEFPSGYTYDPAQGAETVIRFNGFGNLYGRIPTNIGDNGIPDDFMYFESTIYVRPTTNITVEYLEYYFNEDFPSSYGVPDGFPQPGGLFPEIPIHADIYFGPVSPPNFNTLVTSGLVKSNYKRREKNSNAPARIILDTPVTMTGGTVYGFRFKPQEDGGSIDYNNPYEVNLLRKNILYSIQNCTLSPDPNTNKLHVRMFNTWNGGANSVTVTDSGHNAGMYPNFICGGNATRKLQVIAYGRNANSTYTPVHTGYINMNYYDPSDVGGKRYASEGPDFTGINPSRYFIFGQDMGITITGNIKSSYGEYILEFTDQSIVNSGSNITTIDVYETDVHNPSHYFSTSANIKSLGIQQSMEDARNDVIVIGDLIAAVRDYTTQEIINKDNPTLDYIYSRATDVSSINNPDALNNIGRKKPFIVYEPQITDQRHADWLALAILNRYRTFKDIPQWDAIGVPYLQPNDNVIITDASAGGIYFKSSYQWISELSESISHDDYSMNISTIPYAPWASYQPSLQPSLSDFANQAFINIRMTDTADYIRGRDEVELPMYDVYESETSGVRLRAKYDQVIDGDIIVKVVSRKVMGVTTERTVAYLVGHLEDGFEIPEFREWGTNYELIWDGVDQTGESRRFLGQSISEQSSGGNIVQINDQDYIADYRQPGFYAASGDYYLKFTVFPKDTSIPKKDVHTGNLIRTVNTEIADRLSIASDAESYEQYWQLMWGTPPSMQMTVSGQRPSAAARNITYSPDNNFYEDEFDSTGILFTFEMQNGATINSNRVLYYNVSIDHIWALGYTFLIRNDQFVQDPAGGTPSTGWPVYDADDAINWKEAYFNAIQGNYDMKFDRRENVLDISTNVTSAEWNVAGLISTPSSEEVNLAKYIRNADTLDNNYWNEKKPLDIPSRQFIVNDGGRYRVCAWAEVPYIGYHVADYIESTAHRYYSENPIRFKFLPTSARAGGWEFLQVPDLAEDQYEVFRKNLALAAYYAGPTNNEDERLQLMTAHAFQVNTLIWDGTGRLIKTTGGQLIAKEMPPHTHEFWDSEDLTTHTEVPEHVHRSEDKIILSRDGWYRSFKNINSTNYIYDMTNSGVGFSSDSVSNYGIGLCNITGMVAYGSWTWHGYWQSAQYADNKIDFLVPFAHWELPEAQHWIRYPMPDDTTELIYGIADYKTPGNSAWVFWEYEDGLTQAESEEAALENFINDHTHLPIYEGLSVSQDPHGRIIHGVDGLVLAIQANILTFNVDTNDGGYVGTTTALWHDLAYGHNILFPTTFGYNKGLSTALPACWYKLDKTFNWSTDTGTEAYWTNFLIESGVSFFYGGYSDLLNDE